MCFIKEINRDLSKIFLQITAFDGVKANEREEIFIQKEIDKREFKFLNSNWETEFKIVPSEEMDGKFSGEACFNVIEGALENANVSIKFELDNWSTSNYVLIPAAAYNGNRFKIVKKAYPPMLHVEDGIGKDMETTITDVPHLNINDGKSQIHLRSGDMATPCIGIHNPKTRKGLIVLFSDTTAAGYTGIKLVESPDRKTAAFHIEAPAVREQVYHMCSTECKSDDAGFTFKAGNKISLRFNIYTFDSYNVSDLFEKFFAVRKELSGETKLLNDLPFSKAFGIIEDKFKKYNINKEIGYIRVGTDDSVRYRDWQTGWVGGGMNSLSFLADGDEEIYKYACKTMDAVFERFNAKSGFIYGGVYKNEAYGEDFTNPKNFNLLLLRKNADLLIFAARHILLLQKRGKEVPRLWIDGLTKLADAFDRLWGKYGQLGQFIDIAEESIIQGGTASAAIAPGGLALSYQVTGNEKYLQTAEEIGKYYYDKYVSKGILNGGPGEILQNTDSESAFGMLEAYAVLYELTRKEIYLTYARETAYQCATWVVSYDFDFPADTVFAKLGMKTTGSVYANTQNKHSAPGICTLSGQSLLKLYRATGDRKFIELCRDIVHNITQYLSRSDRQIQAWDGSYLPDGFMCERVNMCDWEGKECIGGVFNGSCWCETTCLLIYSEIPGIWMMSDTGEVIVFDHVEANVADNGESWLLTINNPTKYDATVKILTEPAANYKNSWGEAVLENAKAVNIDAGKKICLSIKKYSSDFELS